MKNPNSTSAYKITKKRGRKWPDKTVRINAKIVTRKPVDFQNDLSKILNEFNNGKLNIDITNNSKGKERPDYNDRTEEVLIEDLTIKTKKPKNFHRELERFLRYYSTNGSLKLELDVI